MPVTVDGFLIAHGSALILPLAVIEGPLVSVAVGFLSAHGYFDWWWALFLLIVGDLVGDAIYYWIGHSGKTGLTRLLRRLGVRGSVNPDLRQRLRDNATKMLCIGKWTQSIGVVVLIGSGMLRLPLAKFLLVNLLATLPKSALLLGVGFFAGAHAAVLEEHAVLGTIALGVLGAAGIFLVLRRGDVVRADGAGR